MKKSSILHYLSFLQDYHARPPTEDELEELATYFTVHDHDTEPAEIKTSTHEFFKTSIDVYDIQDKHIEKVMIVVYGDPEHSSKSDIFFWREGKMYNIPG